MTDILAEICTAKRKEVAQHKAQLPEATLRARVAEAPPVRRFAAALERRLAEGQYGLIAELKKASPSRGLIRPDFDPHALARAYHAGGATCLSVVTDGLYFQGASHHVHAAREAAPLPVLRKEFILDPYQVFESRLLGADCILLIMAALTDAEAEGLATLAGDLDLDVLVEVHDAAELERALRLEARLIGINNRNLKTLEVDLGVAEALAPKVPPDRLVVGESGLQGPDDLDRLAAAGARCFLVGESLMRAHDVAAATRRLLRLPRGPGHPDHGDRVVIARHDAVPPHGDDAHSRVAAERPARAEAEPAAAPHAPAGFTHLDAEGRARMVDVSDKDETDRVAVAGARVVMRPETLARIQSGDVSKGDVLAVARLAGIMAAKRTAELIPLCHPLALTSVAVDLHCVPERSAVEIIATCRLRGRTGVEMEALTAASIAALTVYDMCKSVDRGMEVTDLRLLRKSGGASGNWSAGNWPAGNGPSGNWSAGSREAAS